MLSKETLENIAKNNNFQDKQLLTELTELLQDRPEACEFVHLYGEYCEVMDDLVDEEVTTGMVDKAGLLRMRIGQCAFWQKWNGSLALVERLIHHTYFDSVAWENDEEEWKRRDAKALSHCAYNMLFSVILIEFGDETLKKFSLRFRTHAHLKHINDPI